MLRTALFAGVALIALSAAAHADIHIATVGR